MSLRRVCRERERKTDVEALESQIRCCSRKKQGRLMCGKAWMQEVAERDVRG